MGIRTKYRRGYLLHRSKKGYLNNQYAKLAKTLLNLPTKMKIFVLSAASSRHNSQSAPIVKINTPPGNLVYMNINEYARNVLLKSAQPVTKYNHLATNYSQISLVAINFA